MIRLFLILLLILPVISVAAPVTVEQRGIDFFWEYPYPDPDGWKIECNSLITDFPDGTLRRVSMADVEMDPNAQQTCSVIAYINHPEAGYLEAPRSAPYTGFFTRVGVPYRSLTVDGPEQAANFGAIWENVGSAGN